MATDVPARPLGVRASFQLTDDDRRTLRVLQDYDLTPVRDRLLKDGTMPSTWVDEAIFEFRRFLGLRILGGPMAMVSKQVDDVWHTCLLFSRLYSDLCHQAFGRFVHHDPMATPDPDPEPKRRAFEEAYVSLYGELGRMWRMGRRPDH
jgi:hypothetical protein